MERDFEIAAIIIIAVFGALTIGGLMAATIAYGERAGFLLALGASTLAWGAGHAMILQKPAAFRWLVIAAVVMAAAGTAILIA